MAGMDTPYLPCFSWPGDSEALASRYLYIEATSGNLVAHVAYRVNLYRTLVDDYQGFSQ